MINIETLMGHTIGISNSYYKVIEQELLEYYLKPPERRESKTSAEQ
ncbi:MAG: hypothetical protein ACJ71A_13535 [Nitrososphaeraceae archaeon]